MLITNQNNSIKTKNIKLCLVASAGGHLNQLLKLTDGWASHDVFYVTTTEVVRDRLKKLGRVYVVEECNRQHPVKVLKVLFKCLRIIFYEKPKVVISTGAAIGCIVCFLGKIIGARLIWIDSITNVQRLSLSGRLVRHISDLFLVQWPELTKTYKKVEFAGAVI